MSIHLVARQVYTIIWTYVHGNVDACLVGSVPYDGEKWSSDDGLVTVTSRLLAANVVELLWTTTPGQSNATHHSSFIWNINATATSDDAVDGIEGLIAMRVLGVEECNSMSCSNVTDSCVVGECDVRDSRVSLQVCRAKYKVATAESCLQYGVSH
jgi:hypothetical protein